eukprot:5279493-Amphidinium_carterae.5
MGHEVTALMLEKCPPVLSLGRHIAQGNSFAWNSANGACLKAPNGGVICLRVENHVPVLGESLYVALSKGLEHEAFPSEEQGEVLKVSTPARRIPPGQETLEGGFVWTVWTYIVVTAIRHFIGECIPLVEVKVRADNAREYEYATRTLGLAWYRPTPHCHQSNGKIERCIWSFCEMTRRLGVR